MSRLIAVAVLLVCVEHGASFSVQLGLPAAASGQFGNIRNMRARALRSMGRTQFVMQRAEESWNVGRFAKTFGFFNGNPLLRLLPFLPSGEPSVRQPKPLSLSRNELLLWNFEGMEQRAFENMWAPLDDVVMGGVSVSNIKLAEHGATLVGETSSRNNGGFCSARSKNCDPPYDITGYSSLGMRVRCDKGMRYKVILRDAPGWDTIAWCFSFDTKAGQWVDLKVALKDFIPVVRGSTLRDAPRKIDTANIYSVQVMLSKYEYDGALNPNFQEGPFSFDFGAVRALK